MEFFSLGFASKRESAYVALPSSPCRTTAGRVRPNCCECKKAKSTACDLFSETYSLALTFPDRKSTRLNSSHSQISYAVFCLKKKKTSQSFSPPQAQL